MEGGIVANRFEKVVRSCRDTGNTRSGDFAQMLSFLLIDASNQKSFVLHRVAWLNEGGDI